MTSAEREIFLQRLESLEQRLQVVKAILERDEALKQSSRDINNSGAHNSLFSRFYKELFTQN